MRKLSGFFRVATYRDSSQAHELLRFGCCHREDVAFFKQRLPGEFLGVSHVECTSCRKVF